MSRYSRCPISFALARTCRGLVFAVPLAGKMYEYAARTVYPYCSRHTDLHVSIPDIVLNYIS